MVYISLLIYLLTYLLGWLWSSDRQLSQSSEQVSPDEASSRRGSTPSDSAVFPGHLYSSNPDLTSLASGAGDDSTGTLVGRRRAVAEQVVKVFRADQTFRYLVVHRVRGCFFVGSR